MKQRTPEGTGRYNLSSWTWIDKFLGRMMFIWLIYFWESVGWKSPWKKTPFGLLFVFSCSFFVMEFLFSKSPLHNRLGKYLLYIVFIRIEESQIQGCLLLTYMAYQRIRKVSGTPLPIWLAYCITLVDFGSIGYFRIGCYWSFGFSPWSGNLSLVL